jgi:hypothetical protein
MGGRLGANCLNLCMHALSTKLNSPSGITRQATRELHVSKSITSHISRGVNTAGRGCTFSIEFVPAFCDEAVVAPAANLLFSFVTRIAECLQHTVTTLNSLVLAVWQFCLTKPRDKPNVLTLQSRFPMILHCSGYLQSHCGNAACPTDKVI